MKKLINKTITDITLSDDNERITFKTTEGDVIADCYAECCSHTWVENLELPALGFPCTVLSEENLDMPDLGDMPGCEYVEYYGYKIETDKGSIIIDYRNDSNGYYGGSLEWTK